MAWNVITVTGVTGVIAGAAVLTDAVLAKRRVIKPGTFWGASANVNSWLGIGYSALGLGMLSYLAVAEPAATLLNIIWTAVFIAAILIGNKQAKKGSDR